MRELYTSCKANTFGKSRYLSIQTPIFHKNIRLATILYFRACLEFFKLIINPDSYRDGFGEISEKEFIGISD